MTTNAMPGVPAPTTLTPPSSSHGNGASWNFASEKSTYQSRSSRAPLTSQNGNAYPSNQNQNHLTAHDPTARKIASSDQLAKAAKAAEAGYMSPPFPDSAVHEDHTPADSTSDLGATRVAPKRSAANLYNSEDPNDPNSHWIHRDKLAKIENAELQAAGFVLPKPRSSSKARGSRDRSSSRPRKGSKTGQTMDITVPNWDLRLPDEVATNDYFVSGGARGGSRIPVAKTSPLPIPEQHLERDFPVHTKNEDPENGSIRYPKPRSQSTGSKVDTTPPSNRARGKRSATTEGGSPRKNPPPASRKIPGKGSTPGRPKSRSGPNKDSVSSTGTRPSTRGGELSGSVGSKPMEGEPPWMISAYAPDPKLPPEEQLLPTVARRLQQERWEKEGKFGSIYDTDFRPLTDEGFLKPPEMDPNMATSENEKVEPDWPLKDGDQHMKPPSSPSSPSRAGGYSTMPKIQDKPTMSPLPSPLSPHPPATRISTQQVVIRLPDPPEEEVEPQKKGCGCCIVM